MRGADTASDHQLVRTKIKLKLKRKQQTKANRRKFDTIKLQQPAIRLQFSIKFKNRFDVLQEYEELEDNAEKKWQEFENATIFTTRGNNCVATLCTSTHMRILD